MTEQYLIYIREECPPIYVEPVCIAETLTDAIKIVKMSNDTYAYMPLSVNPKFYVIYTCMADILIYKDDKDYIYTKIINKSIYRDSKIIPINFQDNEEITEIEEYKSDEYNMYKDHHCIHICISATSKRIANYGQTLYKYFNDLLVHKKIPEQVKVFYGERNNYE